MFRVFPDNIHEKLTGRLHISLTRVYDGKNILVNQFSSKEEVIQVRAAFSKYKHRVLSVKNKYKPAVVKSNASPHELVQQP